MSLGSLLGLPEALLGSFWPPKNFENKRMFFQLFANSAFWVLEALDGRLGAHLGPFLGRFGFKQVPKMTPEVVQKLFCPNHDPYFYPNKRKFQAPKWAVLLRQPLLLYHYQF